MPLSSAERFRIYKAKLKLEENKSLLEKFREKDAAAHRKSRQENKNNPDKTAKIREQNRKRQAKRRSKLAAEKKTTFRIKSIMFLNECFTIRKFIQVCSNISQGCTSFRTWSAKQSHEKKIDY